MRLILRRQFWVPETKSLFGVLQGPNFRAMTVEREWADNLPFKSCFPPGFYHLVPHHGTKYQNTMAFVGKTVSHLQETGIARSSCVLHWSSTGKGLEGCVSVARTISASVAGIALREPLVDELLELLRTRQEPHYVMVQGFAAFSR